mmetsp:Transcript_32286/g.81554  ORF Transcript_32286/g.81554 Transcript_32286/m.81554 type:complete len:322 (-) Transcript_32286:78-1043(-)
MTLTHQVLHSYSAREICSFLQCRDLSSAELAGFDQRVIFSCWNALRLSAEASLIGKEWLPQIWLPLPEHPKAALREINKRLLSIAQIPASWAPAIRRVSAERLKIFPRTHSEVQRRRAHHSGVEDYVGSLPPAVPPKRAAVTMALGLDADSHWVVGVRMSANKAHFIGEGCLIGAAFIGTQGGLGLVTTLLFAPVSGRVFVTFAEDNSCLAAQSMPALEERLMDDDEHEEIEAFLCLGIDGAVSFCRRRVGEERVEWSGEVPREFFPAWAEHKFATLDFQIDQLKAPAEVLVTWAGPQLPAALASAMPLSKFDATWNEHRW